jgi:NAD+ kinase
LQSHTLTLRDVLVFSKYETSQIENALQKYDFHIVKKNPDFILCFGGDGTILLCERKFPQVPKLIIKKSVICRKCDYFPHQIDEVLSKIKEGEFKIQTEIKLETEIDNKKLVGLNEIQIRAKLPIYALRFSTSINGETFENLIGDGLIVATPFGSTGYYKSTGGERFLKGIGVSFNNLHNRSIKSIMVSENSIIKTEIDRGPAWVITDNYEQFFELKDNEISTIIKSDNFAKFIYIPKIS